MFVDLTRAFHGLIDCVLGDFVESDALEFLCNFLAHSFLEDLRNMPGYGFALAVRVGCEEDLIGFLCFCYYICDDILFFRDNLIMRDESPFYVYGFLA